MVIIHALTHYGRVTHICVSELPIIGSDNGLSPGRRQAIIWTNAGILLIRPLGTNFSEILIEIHTFSFKKINLKMSSGKWWRFCLGLNVLIIAFSIEPWDLSCLLIYRQTSYVNLSTQCKCWSATVGAAEHLASVGSAKTAARRDEKHLSFGICCVLY